MHLLAGSTGFLGNEILKILGKKNISTIALARRTIPNLPHNAKELIIDFNDIRSINLPSIDDVYLSLGYPLYYQNVMGFMSSALKKKFFEVDFIYQMEIAKKAKEIGAKSISLISAVGADPNSWNYYLKTKGILEEEIINLEFDITNIFRPGHLMGNKNRLDIVLADMVSITIDPFLYRSFEKFRSISVKKLSKSVVNKSMDSKPGIHTYEYKDFKNS
jgi:hypothetical protein|tara:strand:+ start:261 stop:914 length:654 start_codon:yes stop_codon:yes gene_type:complete